MQIIRATKTAEQAGAYYVRIQAMARKHQITLYAEFDEHDTPETKYIVVVDDYLPVATCRLYAIDNERVMLGRIVVLPEYRHQGLGTLVVQEAEKWAKELGFTTTVLESRDNKIHKTFYFHCAMEGDKLDCIAANPTVALSAVTKCAPTVGPKDGSFTLQYKSAMAVGKAEMVTRLP